MLQLSLNHLIPLCSLPVHPPSPKRCFSANAFSWPKSCVLLGPVLQMCHGMWFRCSFPICCASCSPSSSRYLSVQVTHQHVKFLFKILLSVASLGYLFDMSMLSTWEETLAHQLGRKALGCAASVYLFCFSELNIPTLTHPHLPTPHQGAYFLLSVVISLKLLLLAFSLLLLPNQTPASRLRSFWVISLTLTLPCITLS